MAFVDENPTILQHLVGVWSAPACTHQKYRMRWSDPEVHPRLKILAPMGTHFGMADHITRLRDAHSSGALFGTSELTSTRL